MSEGQLCSCQLEGKDQIFSTNQCLQKTIKKRRAIITWNDVRVTVFVEIDIIKSDRAHSYHLRRPYPVGLRINRQRSKPIQLNLSETAHDNDRRRRRRWKTCNVENSCSMVSRFRSLCLRAARASVQYLYWSADSDMSGSSPEKSRAVVDLEVEVLAMGGGLRWLRERRLNQTESPSGSIGVCRRANR